LDALVAAGSPGALLTVDGPGGRWAGTSGVADIGSRAPVPPDGRFRAASLTKALVATVVMQLVAAGQLDLDQPVDGGATVRQLLNHTGGLADYMAAPEFSDPLHYTRRTYTPQQLIAYAQDLDKPGPGFHYSNTGYIVLGLLVERVTGHRLGDEINRRVLRPLGMTQSSFPLHRRTIDGPHATGYYARTTDDLVPLTEIDPSFEWAAFGLVSSGRDLNTFFHALFSGRLGVDVGQMTTGIPTPQAPVFPHYGLGLESIGLTCGEFWGGTGQTVGYQTMSFTAGGRHVTLSMNVERLDPHDPRTGPMLLAAVNVINEYVCGEPYRLPGSASPATGSL
jgi:D-alanyl-D-alanine carboxypeptidase